MVASDVEGNFTNTEKWGSDMQQQKQHIPLAVAATAFGVINITDFQMLVSG